ncbi:MAG: hypothetical protein IKY45_02560 [Clostridia bacterium]|nr:hypothetical protein [Clostridia bacterium]
MKETINQRITKYRRFRGYTQAQMAEWLGMKSSTYSQCERVGKITCEQIISISEILKLDVGTLLYGEKKAKPPITPPQEMEFTLMEKNIIKIIRNLKKQDRAELISIIEKYYKKSR